MSQPNLPSENELRQIARSWPPLERAAMAREILRLRSELEKAQAEVKRLEGERDKLQDAKGEP